MSDQSYYQDFKLSKNQRFQEKEFANKQKNNFMLFLTMTLVVTLMGLIAGLDMAPHSNEIFAQKLDYSQQDLWIQNLPEGQGKLQSPINIIMQDVVHDNNIQTMTLLNAYYHNLHHVDLVNKGYTLELDDVTLGYIKVKTLDGQSNTYNAKFLQFHTPSEHQVDSKQFDLEMVIEHELKFTNSNYKFQRARVCILFNIGQNNKFLEFMNLDNIKTNTDDKVHIEKRDLYVPLKDFINKLNIQDFVHYQGSMTNSIPLEIVNYFVNTKPVEVSQDQIQTIRQYFLGFLGTDAVTGEKITTNNRKIQPTNNRPLVHAGKIVIN